MAATENRKVTIKINGKEVADNIKAIEKEFHSLRNSVKKAERGSDDYNRKVKELRKIKGVLDQHRKQVGGMRKAWGGFGNFMKAQLGPLLAISTLVNVLRGAFNTIKEFGQAQANLASVLGKTREEIVALEADSKRLGAITSFTAAEVSNLQTEYAKLGFSEQEILNVTEATLSLAAATNTELGEAATVAGSSLRAFGLEATDMQRVVDVMAKSFSSSGLDMEKWKESMKAAAPLARAAGVSIEDTAAMLGKLADSGIHGSMAGTSLKKIFNELSKDGKPLAESLGNVKKALDEATSPAERLAIANDLVGERGQAALLVLAEQSEKVGELAVALGDAGGAAEKMADTQLNTLDGRLKILGSAWDGLILQFSEGEGGLMAIVNVISMIVVGFQEATKDIQDNFSSLQDAFSELGESMGLMSDEGESTVNVLDFVTTAVKLLMLPLKLFITQIEIVISGFRALIEGGKAAFDFLSDFKMDNGTEAFKEALGAYGDSVAQLMDDVVEPFAHFFEDPKITESAAAAGGNAAKSFSQMSTQELKKELKKSNELLKNQFISPELKESLRKQINEISGELSNKKQSKPESSGAADRVMMQTMERLEAQNLLEIDSAVELEAVKDQLMLEGYARRAEAHGVYLEEEVKKEEESQRALAEAKREMLSEALDTGFTLLSQGADRNEQRELDGLQKKKDAGIISEAEYEKEKEKIQKAAFNKKKGIDIAQALINGALAITKTTAQTGVLAPLAIPAIVASTAGQVAMIASQKYAAGGMFDVLNGPSHSSGGMPVIDPSTGQVRAEMEGGEMIIRKNSVNASTLPTLRSINESGQVPGINYKGASENLRMEKGGVFGGADPGAGSSELIALIKQQNAIMNKWQREFKVNLPLRDLEDEQARKEKVEKLAGIAT